MSQLYIPPEYEKATFDKIPSDMMAHVERMAKREVGEHGEIGIALVGPVGSGKTWYAWCIVDYFMKTQELAKFPVFYTESSLLDRLRYYANKERPERYSDTFFHQTKTNPELLILDDFGSSRQTDFSIELLCDMLEHRIAWRLPTVITSNIEFDAPDGARQAIEIYGERIISRISGRFAHISLTGDDKRQG